MHKNAIIYIDLNKDFPRIKGGLNGYGKKV